MRCPGCAQHDFVEQVARNNVRLDVCPSCRGIWFDRGELERVMPEAVRDLEIPWKSKERRHGCPRCAHELRAFKYPQTLVNVSACKSCGGLWLDAGEFQEIHKLRELLRKKGKLEPDPVGGFKGKLLGFISSAIEGLNPKNV